MTNTNKTQGLEKKLDNENSFFSKVYSSTIKLDSPYGAYRQSDFSNSYKYHERKIKALLEKVEKYGISLSDATYNSGSEYVTSHDGDQGGMSHYCYQTSPDTYKLETKKGSVHVAVGESQSIGITDGREFHELYRLPKEISLSFHYKSDSDKKEILENLFKSDSKKEKTK